MSEIDIVYGAGKKLHDAIVRTHQAVQPKAIFVHATCVSGLIGEDIEAVCKDAEADRRLSRQGTGKNDTRNLVGALCPCERHRAKRHQRAAGERTQSRL